MDPKLSRVVTQDERTSPTQSRNSLISRSRDKKRNFISPLLLSRVVTQDERTPPTKSRDSSISRSRDKIKNVISPNLGGVVTQDEGTPPTKSRDTSTTWSCDNSKTLYLHFHKAYGSQTQQDTGFSVVITIEICAEGNWLIQAQACFYPSLPKEYNISNVKEAVGMQRKACACRK